MSGLVSKNGENSFQVFNGTNKLGFVDSPISGEHNASNFLVAYGIASEFGVILTKSRIILTNSKVLNVD